MDVEILKKVALFQFMSAPQLMKLLGFLREVKYTKNTHILRSGAKGTEMFVIADGMVRISQIIAGRNEEALTILEPGAYFGEMALIEDTTRSADAIAHTDCMLYELSREQFDYLTFTDKEITINMLWSFVITLSNRLRDTNNKLQSFIALSAYGIK